MSKTWNKGAMPFTSTNIPISLPHPALVFLYHRLPHLTSPSLLKFRHVLDDAVCAKLSGRVWVHRHQHPREFGFALLAPHSRKSQEIALLGSESVDLFRRLACFVLRDHVLQSHQGDTRPAIVGVLFAQREPAIQFEILNRYKATVFIGNATRAVLEFRMISASRPFTQFS